MPPSSKAQLYEMRACVLHGDGVDSNFLATELKLLACALLINHARYFSSMNSSAAKYTFKHYYAGHNIKGNQSQPTL